MPEHQRYTFPRSHKLSTSGQFKQVFSAPQNSTDRYLTVLAHKNELGYPRLGLAIAKKRIKTASRRNQIKRLIRESFRLHKHLLGELDVVVLARDKTVGADNHALFRSLQKHWNRLSKSCVTS